MKGYFDVSLDIDPDQLVDQMGFIDELVATEKNAMVREVLHSIRNTFGQIYNRLYKDGIIRPEEKRYHY